jgi:S1-C subfamily serine protease
MYYTDPDHYSQQQPSASSPDPQAQAGQPSSRQNAQPGYPYGIPNTQPGYPFTAGHVPHSSAPGAPTWYQPGTPLPQASDTQQGLPQQTSSTLVGSPRKPKRSKARSVAIFALTCLLAVVFGIGLFSGWTFAHSGASTNSPVASSTSPSTTVSTSDSQTAREAAIAKVSPAVVEIIGQVSQGTALGSGIIVDKNGDIVTNHHVVDGATSLMVVLSDGRRVSAQLVGSDAANDLAILRIQPFSGMTVATLGDSSRLTIGQEVLAIGNPLGYSGTVTSGVVSALDRSADESRTVKLTGLIQTSAPINPGNSGGALINLQGEVVGIPTLSAINNETNTPANGIGFAIPSNQVKAAMTQILG